MKLLYRLTPYCRKIGGTLTGLLTGLALAQAQPVNDNPCGAQLLPVNTYGYYCPSSNSGTTNSATNTGVPSTPSCSSITGDVWYKFIAAATSHKVTRSNIVPVNSGSTVNPGIAIYSSTAADCNTLSEIGCSTSPSLTLSGLTIGNTYYIRIWTAGYNGNPQFTFDLCIGTAPGVPPNNECTQAISLNDGSTHTVYTNNATESLPASDCGWGSSTTGALDVWYKVTAGATGPITLEANGYESYINLEAYDACGGTPIGCDDNNPAMLMINAVAGNTYYARLYGRDGSGYMTLQALGQPLPIGDNRLVATLTAEGEVALSWQGNTAGIFSIERSPNGIDFSSIGSVASPEHSNERTEYRYTDLQPLQQANYYRIRNQDIDGQSTFSNIAYLNRSIKVDATLTIYPNPSAGIFHINITDQSKAAITGHLTVVDASGKTIKTVQVRSSESQLDMSNVPPGIYQIKYTDALRTLHYKLVKLYGHK